MDRVVIPIFVGLVIRLIKSAPIKFWDLEMIFDPTILISHAMSDKLLLQNIINDDLSSSFRNYFLARLKNLQTVDFHRGLTKF